MWLSDVKRYKFSLIIPDMTYGVDCPCVFTIQIIDTTLSGVTN